MKTNQQAFALVLVLAVLTVISLLALSLLSGVTHGLRLGQNDANRARESMLADSAAALVIGQLQQATTPAGEAWISQPGLIRTYSAASPARTPSACYKLYSALQMTDTAGSLAFLATDVPADWNSTANQNVYTDLNAPLESLLGSAIYPILDANAVTSVTGLSSDSGHAVEMPVAWLYELQDGTLGPASAATATNPMMGRIAFWTDDETSKIDLNTAGEGSPWNTPRTNSAEDITYATTQPASGEFERYPGHPAGVSLDVLFGAGTTANLTTDQILAMTPRYNAGGSEFGTVSTTIASTVTPKLDRLYGSVDELSFSASLNDAGQRVANAITPAELNLNRFVMTVHSQAPETTLLGEPRTSIWPVSDLLADSQHTTANDRAAAADATIGRTAFYFARHDPTSATADLDPAIEPGNAALLAHLISAGAVQLPGYAGTFAQKYPGAQWPQLALELLDAIRGFNAVDPAAGSLTAPTSFVPFAAGTTGGVGRGLVVPLTSTYQGTTLRAIGRYPTLYGLTLVLYVSGYVLNDGTHTWTIDYEKTPDYAPENAPAQNGAGWKTSFTEAPLPASQWKYVKDELVRAFLVPTTFQPGCGFPEVSDACSIQISGLDRLTATVKGVQTSFGFPPVCTSRLLSDALTVLPADRSWGGFEGPQAWRAAALDAMNNTSSYTFAGTQPITVPIGTLMDGKTGGPSGYYSWTQMTTSAVNPLTVQILDGNGNSMQTLSLDLPALSGTPVVNGEADHFDGSTPSTSTVNWSTNSSSAVLPSYYMTLRNRLLATQRSRALMIQAGDASLSVEPTTDPRLIASLASVPATCFHQATTTKTQAAVTNPSSSLGAHYHNLRFADGTSACFIGTLSPTLVGNGYATNPLTISAVDWNTGGTVSYSYTTGPAASAPLTTNGTMMMVPPGSTASGPIADWDTGPGFAPDGALTNLPDAGSTLDPTVAYQSLGGGLIGAATRRSPNALIPSPVIFGSLPAGIDPVHPGQSQAWRTLLFCPYPASDQAHPGLASPPDYLLLDRFWMPCVEPYGISTRFATAGKINLNDQIAPFTYLHRNTALHALLHNLRIPAISPASSTTYKSGTAAPIASVWNTVNEDATIAQIENRFAQGDAYLTEGEICSVPLIPQNIEAATPEIFWTSRTGGGFLTGDNLRELPYAEIYSRLTTRSNSFTVHIHAQVLQKLHDKSAPNVWREGVDRVVGDWRGSYEIERYLDPAATAPVPGAALGPYKFRIVSERRFTP